MVEASLIAQTFCTNLTFLAALIEAFHDYNEKVPNGGEISSTTLTLYEESADTEYQIRIDLSPHLSRDGPDRLLDAHGLTLREDVQHVLTALLTHHRGHKDSPSILVLIILLSSNAGHGTASATIPIR